MKKKSVRYRLMVCISALALLLAAVGVQYGFAQSGYPARVTTETLTMTGLSPQVVRVITETLTMSGKPVQPLQVYTETLTMTGKSSQPLQIRTDTLTMTGKR
ncbi:MAG: hypothetical protein JXC33_01300 [Deltaproteobacteria bacterium]|nr:hypothetical protein [Deltaproteobacteria bacterium]